MNWNKLKKIHYFTDPVEHIHTTSIFEIAEYDKLYENQNNLNHKLWQEFDEKYHTGFTFLEDITNIDLSREVIALWFFKERSSTGAQPDVNMAGKLIAYYPNAFLLTCSNDIKIVEKKKKYIRRPVIQLDLNIRNYKKIIENINVSR